MMGDVPDHAAAAAANPVTVEVPLRWGDMDAFGHVNNVLYLRYLEEARVIGFHEWFGDDDPVKSAGVLVARSEIEYLRPLEHRPEPVCVDMWVSRVAGASFDLGYQVRDPEGVGTAVYALAESTLVMYDFATASPTRITDAQRAVLARHQGEPVALRRRR